MYSTNASLLGRLQQSSPIGKKECWSRFCQVYTPLLQQWATKLGVPVSDQNDVVQETLVKLLLSISTYKLSSGTSFRGWLYSVMRNAWIDLLRRRQAKPMSPIEENQLADLGNPNLESEEREYRQYVLRRVHDLVVSDFPDQSQKAFQSYVIEGRPANEVGAELGITANAVYLIRTRILRRIREELVGLID